VKNFDQQPTTTTTTNNNNHQQQQQPTKNKDATSYINYYKSQNKKSWPLYH